MDDVAHVELCGVEPISCSEVGGEVSSASCDGAVVDCVMGRLYSTPTTARRVGCEAHSEHLLAETAITRSQAVKTDPAMSVKVVADWVS